MALSNTNISIAVVQNAIGVHSTSSLGALIALAQSGGVGGYAFYINETYGSTGRRDGYLIAGAKPYWNMYSPKIPAEWFCNPTGFVLDLRLKRNALNENGGYDFRLHDFREYEHDINVAEKPDLWISSLEVWEGTSIDLTARFYKYLIDLSIANRSGGALTHYLIVFTKNSVNTTSAIIPLDNSGTDVPTLTFAPTVTTTVSMAVYLLPTNVDTGRVSVPSQFLNVNGEPNASTSVEVRVKYYPQLGVDTSNVYNYDVNLDAVLDNSWEWSTTDTEGTARIVANSSSTTPIDVKITNNGVSNPLNQTMYIRFWGNVSGGRTARAYRNGVQIGSDVTFTVLSAPNSTGYGRTANFGATGFDLNEGDFFEIIVT